MDTTLKRGEGEEPLTLFERGTEEEAMEREESQPLLFSPFPFPLNDSTSLQTSNL